MELDIKTNITNDLVVFNNYETIQQQVAEFVSKYDNMVVSEDDLEQAAKDRALLNKIAKTMNDKRISIEKQFKEQFEPFKNQVNSLIEPIKTASENIDKQVKNFEENTKRIKKEAIQQNFDYVFESLKDLIPFNLVFNEKWLNKGFTFENLQEILNEMFTKINQDLEILNKEEKANQLKDYYINNKFDLSATFKEKTRIEGQEQKIKAIEEKKRIEEEEKKKAELAKLAEEYNQKPITEKYNEVKQEIIEAPKQEEKQEEKKYKVSFYIVETKDKLNLLKDFLVNNNINYEVIKDGK